MNEPQFSEKKASLDVTQSCPLHLLTLVQISDTSKPRVERKVVGLKLTGSYYSPVSLSYCVTHFKAGVWFWSSCCCCSSLLLLSNTSLLMNCCTACACVCIIYCWAALTSELWVRETGKLSWCLCTKLQLTKKLFLHVGSFDSQKRKWSLSQIY